mgnify:CR=1 FL=1
MPKIVSCIFLAALAILQAGVLSGPAEARCICRCVNGSVEPICDSALDIPPICGMQICPIVPPSIAPLAPLTVPPIGTTNCQMQQVLNPATGQYEWRQLCN